MRGTGGHLHLRLSTYVLRVYSDKHLAHVTSIYAVMFADLEYDHLDYSRPGSSWKPHYQRMANGFTPHLKDATSKDSADSAD
jgi:hypothetical protein